MNVLNVITSIEDGGLERHVYYIVNYRSNKDLNHFVAVLTGYKKNDLTDKYEKLGVNIKYFDFKNKSGNINAIIGNIKNTFGLARHINKNKIDILHSHDFFPAFIARISAVISFFCFFHKVKHIFVTLHIVFFWLNKLHHFINRVLGIITTNVVCLSYAILNYSLKTDKLPKDKYCIINTGIDTTKFIPDEKLRNKYILEFGFEESDIILGNIGVLSIRKGQMYLLRAFKELKGSFPRLKLVIFGSEREHELDIRDEILDFIKKNKLENDVKIIKPREDIHLIYNMFDVFVMPSITEGLSACSIEALLMKKICLFSDIEPFTELVTDGYNGFIFKNKSAEDLKAKLEYILININNLDNIRNNARSSADGKFDVRNMVEKYEQLYLK